MSVELQIGKLTLSPALLRLPYWWCPPLPYLRSSRELTGGRRYGFGLWLVVS